MPTQFGTAVHVGLKRQIDALFDPDFRAEFSALKTLDETYGAQGSIRIDVFEYAVRARFASMTSRPASAVWGSGGLRKLRGT